MTMTPKRRRVDAVDLIMAIIELFIIHNLNSRDTFTPPNPNAFFKAHVFPFVVAF
jgi:hypothetical protein